MTWGNVGVPVAITSGTVSVWGEVRAFVAPVQSQWAVVPPPLQPQQAAVAEALAPWRAERQSSRATEVLPGAGTRHKR